LAQWHVTVVPLILKMRHYLEENYIISIWVPAYMICRSDPWILGWNFPINQSINKQVCKVVVQRPMVATTISTIFGGSSNTLRSVQGIITVRNFVEPFPTLDQAQSFPSFWWIAKAGGSGNLPSCIGTALVSPRLLRPSFQQE